MSNPQFTAPNYANQVGTTYKGNIDNSIAAGQWHVNLGLTYSAGTLTVSGSNGTALSSTNPAFVKFRSIANPGQNISVSVEANQNFIDDAGASEIIGNLFGTSTGHASDDDITFTLYAVMHDDANAVAFMISRDGKALVSPAVGLIGAPDDAVADTFGSFFSLDNIDETKYDTNPCVRVGKFRMQKSTLDDWTVQTLGNQDGILNLSAEGPRVEVIEVELSSTATVEFTDLTEDATYRLEIKDYIPSTDATHLFLRCSANNGASYASGASDYSLLGAFKADGASAVNLIDPNQSEITLSSGSTNGSGAGETFNCQIEFGDISSGGQFPAFDIRAQQINSAAQYVQLDLMGHYKSSSGTQAIQLLSSSGNMASGKIRLIKTFNQ